MQTLSGDERAPHGLLLDLAVLILASLQCLASLIPIGNHSSVTVVEGRRSRYIRLLLFEERLALLLTDLTAVVGLGLGVIGSLAPHLARVLEPRAHRSRSLQRSPSVQIDNDCLSWEC